MTSDEYYIWKRAVDWEPPEGWSVYEYEWYNPLDAIMDDTRVCFPNAKVAAAYFAAIGLRDYKKIK